MFGHLFSLLKSSLIFQLNKVMTQYFAISLDLHTYAKEINENILNYKLWLKRIFSGRCSTSIVFAYTSTSFSVSYWVVCSRYFGMWPLPMTESPIPTCWIPWCIKTRYVNTRNTITDLRYLLESVVHVAFKNDAIRNHAKACTTNGPRWPKA